MRGTAEAGVEGAQLLVEHGVAGDRVDEIIVLFLARQFAVEQEISHFHKAGVLRQLADRVSTVQQDAFVAVDISERALATRSGLVTWVKCERAGRTVQLANIDNIRAGASGKDWELVGLAIEFERRVLVCQNVSPVLSLWAQRLGELLRGLRVEPCEGFVPA